MRRKLTIACALAAFVTAGGGAAQAHGLVRAGNATKVTITASRHAAGAQPSLAQKAPQDADGARGGKALTEKEYWRAQWRDEGAVFPGDK